MNVTISPFYATIYVFVFKKEVNTNCMTWCALRRKIHTYYDAFKIEIRNIAILNINICHNKNHMSSRA